MNDPESYCPGCGSMGNDPCAKDCERANEVLLKIPYTYTLPQHFVEDKEVPTRWRVWAVINGFFIGGQYCWASNEWIGEKVKAHKDTVSQAVKELESLKIIRCERGARSRYIYPMIGANAYQWSASTPISDRHQRLSISVSNSEKNTSEQSSATYSVVDTPDLGGELGDIKSPRISEEKRKAYDELIAWSEKERDFKFPKTTITKQYRAFKLANQNGFTRDQLIEKWEEMSTEKFWQKAGFDWMNVVQQLSLKPV